MRFNPPPPFFFFFYLFITFLTNSFYTALLPLTLQVTYEAQVYIHKYKHICVVLHHQKYIFCVNYHLFLKKSLFVEYVKNY